MLYYMIFLIFIMAIFLLNTNKVHASYITMILLAYFIAIFSIILYLSRDTYYYNLLKEYFYLPDFLWKKFFFLDISRFNIIRIMNLSSLLIIPLSLHFSLSFLEIGTAPLGKIIRVLSWLICAIQYIIYDPTFHVFCYYYLYPDFLTRLQYEKLTEIIYFCSKWGNRMFILGSVALIIISFYKSPRLKLFRLNFLFLTLSYIGLSCVYILFISTVPMFHLNISKISDYYTYNTIHLSNDVWIYKSFTVILILALFPLTYAITQLTRLNRQNNLDELKLTKAISASDTTSKIFCHYIKNEVLAIQAELEMIPVHTDNQELIYDLDHRCSHLYTRIDELHRKTRTGELHLEKCSIQALLSSTLEPFSYRIPKLKIQCTLPSTPVIALVDRNYMFQAFDNLFKNAIDAMKPCLEQERRLTVNLTTTKDWILIDISDTGIGISKENLQRIFTPFYSSHPYSQHWGVGLSLTYKIIHAHEGKIEVKSEVGVGTTVELMLPLI